MLIVCSTTAQDLKQHQWKHRVLIVQTEDESHPLYKDQLKELEGDNKSLSNRKIVLYEITSSQFRVTNYADNTISKWSDVEPNFLKKLPENKSFTITLIGLDGGVKMNRNELISIEELFELIDAMPMRIRELQKNKQ